MTHETIFLRNDDRAVTLTTYIAAERRMRRDAMLVIPGGGYSNVCADREGEPIAFAFLARGFNCFVLRYSVGEKAVFPRPLCDASLAMAHIRENADAYNIDPRRVFAVGFSAGGHLCGALGSFWNAPEVRAALPAMPEGINRPTGTILCYPVLTGSTPTHAGTFDNLSGGDAAKRERYSVDRHITADTAPAFFMHTADDPCVPVRNSLLTMLAMAEKGISFDARIYPHGPHGLALADFQTALGAPDQDVPEAARWVEDATAWSRTVPSL